MEIKNIRYTFDVSNGIFEIHLNDNEVVMNTNYNDNNVVIGTDDNNDIVVISIYGFREYVSNLIDEYLKRAIAPFMR